MNDLENLQKLLERNLISMKKSAFQTRKPKIIIKYYLFVWKIKLKSFWIRLRF